MRAPIRRSGSGTLRRRSTRISVVTDGNSEALATRNLAQIENSVARSRSLQFLYLLDERMLSLGRVAVDRSRFPEVHSPNSARQGSSQSLGRLPGTTDGELDLLVDLTG